MTKILLLTDVSQYSVLNQQFITKKWDF